MVATSERVERVGTLGWCRPQADAPRLGLRQVTADEPSIVDKLEGEQLLWRLRDTDAVIDDLAAMMERLKAAVDADIADGTAVSPPDSVSFLALAALDFRRGAAWAERTKALEAYSAAAGEGAAAGWYRETDMSFGAEWWKAGAKGKHTQGSTYLA